LIRGKNENFKVVELENLNHLFQECETGSMDEYKELEQTISPGILEEITNWIDSDNYIWEKGIIEGKRNQIYLLGISKYS
jgi:hypothetical protein